MFEPQRFLQLLKASLAEFSLVCLGPQGKVCIFLCHMYEITLLSP